MNGFPTTPFSKGYQTADLCVVSASFSIKASSMFPGTNVTYLFGGLAETPYSWVETDPIYPWRRPPLFKASYHSFMLTENSLVTSNLERKTRKKQKGVCYTSWANIFRRLFSKRCTFWSKRGTKSLVRRYQAKFAITVPENLKVCHIWLIQFLIKLMFSYIIYSHNSNRPFP